VCESLYSRTVPNVTVHIRIRIANVSIKLGIHHVFLTLKELIRLTYNVYVVQTMYVDIHQQIDTKNPVRNLDRKLIFPT
jgi:hypothetical protein